MATLTGQSIDSSYQGLIKTTDNGAITATAKAVTDGTGNATNIEISNTATNFVSGTVDFTGSTVSGLPGGGAAGLVAGTGADSMQSDSALTTNPANAGSAKSIALGDGATAIGTGLGNIAIGDGAEGGDGPDNYALAIGHDAAAGDGTVAIGNSAGSLTAQSAVVIGNTASGITRTVALGRLANASGTSSISIGNESDADQTNTIAVGDNAQATTAGGISIGHDTRAYGNASSVAIGDDADGHNGGVGIGDGAQAYYGSVAIGKGASSTFTTFGNVHIGEGAKNTTGGNGGNVTIGVNAVQTSNAEKSVAIGYDSEVNVNGAVALGANVTASTADTVSVKALETQTNSTPTAGGIIIADAGGTGRRLNVNAAGDLQVGTNIVGITGWSTAKVSENQAGSSCDTTRSSVLIPAGTVKAGDILQVKSLEQRTGSTGFTYSNLSIHTAGTIGQSQNGAFVSGFQSGSDGFGAHSKTLFVQTADGTGDGTQYLEDNYTPQEQTGGIFSSALGSNTAIDWTVDQYLCVNVCIDNAGATWTNYGAAITIIGRN